MTSPGGWFGGFLDGTLGKKPPTTSPGSSLPRAPSTDSNPGYGGSADSADRQGNPYRGNTPREASKSGQILYSSLDLPKEYANEAFTFGTSSTPYSDGQGNPVNRTDVVQMTVAAGLEWLRNLSVTNKEQYNAWVVKLYDAGYLTESEVRFNVLTSQVAQAFVDAAHDTASVNASAGTGGSITTLGDNLQSLADGAAESGFGPGGSSGRDNTPPPRIDQQLDDDTLRKTIKDTSRSLLGRALTDAEEASLVSRFRSVESQWNDSRYAADVASANGGTATVTTTPNAAVLAEKGIDETLGTERAAQMLGGYAGVLRAMTGMDGSGMIGGTLA